MRLQDKLNDLKEQFLSTAPPETVAVMQKATEELSNSGIMDRVLKPGEVAPSFSLPDANGNLVNSETLLGRGSLVICFYRGVW